MAQASENHRDAILRRRAAFISASLAALSGCGPARQPAGAPLAESSASSIESTTHSQISAPPPSDGPAAPLDAAPTAAPTAEGPTPATASASSAGPPVRFQVCLSVIHPPKVTFGHRDLTLNEDAKAALDEIARLLGDYPHVRVEVQGHVESSEPLYGQRIGLKRAQRARQYLLNNGIAADRLCVRSYGESRPLTPGRTEQQRKANRRVEFRVLERDETCTK